MRINPTVVLTFLLLTMMFGAGAVSARWGLSLGKEALKEITQPEISPTSKREEDQASLIEGEGIIFLKEKEVLKNVKAQMQGKVPVEAPKPKKEEKKATEEPEKSPKKNEEAKPESKEQAGLPIVATDDKVTLEVRSMKKEGQALILDVTLKNESSRSVEFLYSFLSIKDDSGRSLSATTQGLPGKLSPNSQLHSGKVSIPIAVLGDAKKLSMTLTDYPDRKLELAIADIPVLR
ncbi:MAG: hypothetical protein F6J93_06035 [Oscillatoria sp. SIO1A7]|nr:hypothetical protein [Oscillatoria sp. SIO1A7]